MEVVVDGNIVTTTHNSFNDVDNVLVVIHEFIG